MLREPCLVGVPAQGGPQPPPHCSALRSCWLAGQEGGTARGEQRAHLGGALARTVLDAEVQSDVYRQQPQAEGSRLSCWPAPLPHPAENKMLAEELVARARVLESPFCKGAHLQTSQLPPSRQPVCEGYGHHGGRWSF